MTMLDGMRRHRGWLKWSLGLVCLTFVLFYVPSFMTNGGIAGVTGAQSDDTVATVDGHEITAGEYRRLYAQQLWGPGAPNVSAIHASSIASCCGSPQLAR